MVLCSEQAAHITARVTWCLSFALLWVGFLPRGWYYTRFTGSKSYGNVAYEDEYYGYYGLFNVVFVDSQGMHKISYAKWANAAGHADAYLNIHSARVAAVLAGAVSVLTALSYFRSTISKVQVQIFTTKRAFGLSVLDLALTLLVLASWGVLMSSDLFAIMCTDGGCFPLPQDGLTKSILSYSWALWVVRALIQLILCISLSFVAVYTATADEEDEEPDFIASERAERKKAGESPGGIVIAKAVELPPVAVSGAGSDHPSWMNP